MLNIEPEKALALSMHHNLGVYALLLGSGLSRAAGIPTGWEITIDLVRRVAALEGVTDEADWPAWYQSQYGSAPNYSELLDALAPTPAERRAILHRYIEPDDGEDARRPTKAHQAIARLVLDGTVRVIVTTNFDRLLENALREVGIEPTVIASEDALAGATPLVHARCTIIKLHGDYLDARIRNTDDELSSYPPAMDALLDEVFDKFGLGVAGWSGEWDTALRAALLRTPTRRYPMYWAARGTIPQLGQDLIDHRRGTSFQVADADTFFVRLADTVEALRAASRPHPDSVAVAVALAKRYCRDDRYAVEWFELLSSEVAKVRAYVSSDDYPTGNPDNPAFNAAVNEFVARTEILRRLFLVGARWGTERAVEALARALAALSLKATSQGGYTTWISLRDLGATLCFYWGMAGALYRDDHRIAARLMLVPVPTSGSETQPAVAVLPIDALEDVNWRAISGLERHKTAGSDFVFGLLKKELVDVVMAPSEGEDLFDRLEILVSIQFAHHRLQRMEGSGHWFWTPLGRFMWRRSSRGGSFDAYDSLTDQSPVVTAGLLGGTAETANRAVEQTKAFAREHAGRFW